MVSLIVTFRGRFGLMGVLSSKKRFGKPAREHPPDDLLTVFNGEEASLAGLLRGASTPIKPKRLQNVTIKDVIPQTAC